MRTKHTPGPWTSNGRCVSQGDSRTICNATEIVAKSLQKQVAEYEQACANAHLIAAAPEMLEALETLLNRPEDYLLTEDRVMLEAAIRKARGEV